MNVCNEMKKMSQCSLNKEVLRYDEKKEKKEKTQRVERNVGVRAPQLNAEVQHIKVKNWDDYTKVTELSNNIVKQRH